MKKSPFIKTVINEHEVVDLSDRLTGIESANDTNDLTSIAKVGFHERRRSPLHSIDQWGGRATKFLIKHHIAKSEKSALIFVFILIALMFVATVMIWPASPGSRDFKAPPEFRGNIPNTPEYQKPPATKNR